MVELEADFQPLFPVVSTLAAAVNWQHFLWAFIKVDAILEMTLWGLFVLKLLYSLLTFTPRLL